MDSDTPSSVDGRFVMIHTIEVVDQMTDALVHTELHYRIEVEVVERATIAGARIGRYVRAKLACLEHCDVPMLPLASVEVRRRWVLLLNNADTAALERNVLLLGTKCSMKPLEEQRV